MRKIWRDKRSKYRKIIVWIWFFLLFLELTIYPACVQAAGKSITVTVTGLEEQDRLHLYALSQNGEWAGLLRGRGTPYAVQGGRRGFGPERQAVCLHADR